MAIWLALARPAEAAAEAEAGGGGAGGGQLGSGGAGDEALRASQRPGHQTSAPFGSRTRRARDQADAAGASFQPPGRQIQRPRRHFHSPSIQTARALGAGGISSAFAAGGGKSTQIPSRGSASPIAAGGSGSR